MLTKRKASLLDAAVTVLERAQKPMKSLAIWEVIERLGLWVPPLRGKTPWDTLRAALYVEIHSKGAEARFEKVGRGRFLLKVSGQNP